MIMGVAVFLFSFFLFNYVIQLELLTYREKFYSFIPVLLSYSDSG